MRCVFRRNYGSLTIDGEISETSRWRAVVRVLRSPLDAIGSALLPASCSLCGSPLPRLSSIPICESCWAEIAIDRGSYCYRCGDSLEFPSIDGVPEKNLCRACRLAPPPFRRAVAFGRYEGRLRELIHALKYNRMLPAAHQLGAMLAEAIAQLSVEAAQEMLVIPVPLHRLRSRQRGFNQARELAKCAIETLRKSHPEWRLTLAPKSLMRLKLTESQAGLTPTQRRRNVRGAFKVSDPSAIRGKHILLVDDILTTGATARAAAQSLMRAGAGSIYVATLARARRFDANVAQPGSSGLSAQPVQFAGMHLSPVVRQQVS